MKNNFAALVLLGLATYTPSKNNVEALSLKEYQSLMEDNSGGDWDDMLNNESQSSHIPNYDSYNDDTPDSYKNVVDETTTQMDK